MTITLKAITQDNWEAIARLSVSEQQREFIYDNVYSIAEASFNDAAIPRAIYSGKKPIGFVMYDRLEREDGSAEYDIYRFMIDEKYQGKGYGRSALTKIIEEIKSLPDAARITICFSPTNEAAKELYVSVGFEEVGTDEYGQVIAEIRV